VLVEVNYSTVGFVIRTLLSCEKAMSFTKQSEHGIPADATRSESVLNEDRVSVAY
jgi:hypothetical protein